MDGDARLRLELLGALRVRRGDVVLPVPGARSQGLLVRLALAGGRAVGQETLVDAIWAEDLPADPAHALQALVSRLRRTLGSSGAVTQAGGGYRLEVTADGVDALRFELLAATGREHLHAGDPLAAAAVLGEAVAIWGDRPGTEPAAVAAVAPAAAARLAHASLDAVTGLADAELSLGRADAAAARLAALLAEQPVHERAAALLMDALVAQGRQAEALTCYERVRKALADALGTDPGSALRERHLRLLRAERTGDTARPEPPAPSTPGTPPAPLTSFVGRDDDLARIAALLATGRLVTVLGPGGAGKTRLAVEYAHRHRHGYRDGVRWVDLAALTDPAEVAAALLAATGRRGGVTSAARTRSAGHELDVLVDQLAGQESLLLVDNCEHLIDAVARLLAALLPRCAGLRVLATSREPLAVDGEALVPLGPLALPEPDDSLDEARRTASVRLFAERAAAVRPGFTVDDTTLPDIRRVVRGLDGLPLALELAAARMRTLSLPELADGLSDRFRLLGTGSRTASTRHRTLRAVIAWSWELLGDRERTVAERVSVLPGGVTPASATAVCAATSVPAAEIPELLAALVDRSLLQLANEPGRYRMLETLREYGTERLAERGDLNTARDLAAGYFAALLARYDPMLRGAAQLTAVRVLNAEYDNTLAALRQLCAAGDASAAVALALDLTWYWQLSGRHSDADHWLGEALAVPAGERTPERDCATAIHLFHRGVGTRPGMTARESADDRARTRELTLRLLAYPRLPGLFAALAALPLAFRQEEAALALVERAADGDDGWLAGLAGIFRAEFAENAGDVEGMRADVAAALDRFRRVGDRWGRVAALPMRAQIRQYDGDLDGALADLREARSLADEFGSSSPGDQVYRDLRWADLHLRRGETDLATAMIDSARERARRAAGAEMVVLVAVREAGLWLRLGDPSRAGELLDNAERGQPTDIAFPHHHVRAVAGATRAALRLELGDPAGARQALEQAYAAALSSRDLPVLSLVAVETAALAAANGRHHEAAVLLGAASRLRGTHDRTDGRVRELARRSRGALGEAPFDEAYGRGWQLDRRTAATEVDPARTGPHPVGATGTGRR
ncbi:BTAD domain-containing putative transcriptional regulator [Micromonospora humi]|uniref:Predicted ATPase n=1 Tax=Micromonospora humi TaxID=745366 RepID=A0A1C5JPQ1_9ACTN|nr:BTAD domain-containing putative transcriptional regulator [Micromonospora humi]SCG72209.1 Predicted ATPase [Micromonospora humi]